MSYSLSRNARLFVSTSPTITGMTDLNTWQIPILDGFSFTQETGTQEVVVSEAGVAPSRGQQVFNTSIEPVSWNFTNYMRPRFADGNADAVERILWEAIAAPPGGTISTVANGLATSRGAPGDGMSVDFDESNTNQLRTLSLVFDLGGVWYHIQDAVVDTAEIDFSIETIATVAWSGFANRIVEVAGGDRTFLNGMTGTALGAPPTGSNEYVIPPADVTCIRNKLTTVTLEDRANAETTYTLAITGGSLTINNNITYLTPEALGVVNQPCAHFTGARQISGNITAYLRSGATNTAGLMNDLLSYVNQSAPQTFDFNMYVGGTSVQRPVIHLDMPYTHLVIPTINIEDVVSVDIGFSALPYDTGASQHSLSETNEITITYYPDET